jgi:hypothetical protein
MASGHNRTVSPRKVTQVKDAHPRHDGQNGGIFWPGVDCGYRMKNFWRFYDVMMKRQV